MKQKFRVSWQHSQHDAPLAVTCDNWCHLLGCLDVLAELGILFVDISVINE